MKTVRIHVTKNYIKNGKRRNRYSCPISKAVRATLRNKLVKTGVDEIIVDTPKHTLVAKLPKRAQRFIAMFDDRVKPVSPFSFTARFKAVPQYE